MKKVFLVELEIPKGVGIRDMETYIHGAVRSDCGSLPPEDPLFDLDRDSVKVKAATDARLKRLIEAGGVRS